jgi:hypothetical protein
VALCDANNAHVEIYHAEPAGGDPATMVVFFFAKSEKQNLKKIKASTYILFGSFTTNDWLAN